MHPLGEFEILRSEVLKDGELGVIYIQRGEVLIGQIVWCQLYNTGFLSFQIAVNLSWWGLIAEDCFLKG